MRADLHIHTDISDGSKNMQEVIYKAKERDLTHISITNHDTVRGLEEACNIGLETGIRLIPGIEISAYDYEAGKKVHILGYNFDLAGKNIQRVCNPILEKRHENSLWQIEQLKKHGYRIDIENIEKFSKSSGVIYKQHIMMSLIEEGYTDQIYSKLYKEIFKGNGICSRDIEYVDVFEAVEAIKLDGGLAVLAHPGQLDSYYLIEKLVKTGLDGIEMNHEDHSKEDIDKIKNYYGKKYGLLLTGGSDYHGIYGETEIEIGDLVCPEPSFIEKLFS